MEVLMSEIEVRWDEIKNNIKEEYDLSQVSFDTWIVPLKFYNDKDNVVTIIIPSDQSHALKYIDKNYKDFFRIIITEMMHQNYDVKFILEKDTNEHSEGESSYNNVSISDNINYLSTNLIPKYKFETFVVGSNNRFAQNASLAVAETPGQVYNPLFIYGGPGLGKTHLMHSIGHYILEHNPNMKVLYVTCETFTNEVIDSIRSGSVNEIRNKYRTVDVLMVDDVQFIIGKDQTQIEFFNTFNALHDMGKQIILSSDKPPKDLKGLDERLISRFEWGLIADIQSPDYETRLAILKRNAENMNINFSNEIFEYIANNIKYNIRELESALNRIVAGYNINNRYNNDFVLTVDEVDNYLKDIIKPDHNKQITIDNIIETVAREYNVTYNDIVSTKRNAEYAFPRQIVMYISRRLLDTSLEAVAKTLGKKDHTTIMYGANKIDAEMKKDDNFKNKVEELINKISK
jgi:chromosomal replication initiator protein